MGKNKLRNTHINTAVFIRDKKTSYHILYHGFCEEIYKCRTRCASSSHTDFGELAVNLLDTGAQTHTMMEGLTTADTVQRRSTAD